MTRSDALEVLSVAWSALVAESTTFPTFVLTFETSVRIVEEADGPLAPELRRIWGQVEIINALALDEGNPVSSSDLDDTAALVARARDLLVGDGP